MTVHVTAPMLAAYNHFIAVGLTENGAAAPVGNAVQESGEFLVATMFREHPDWSGGVAQDLKSGGIMEWLGDRKTACIAFIGRAEARLGVPKGSLLNDLGTQCDFVVYELQTDPSFATLYQQLTTGTRSIANLTANYCWVYERPAAATANVENRIAHAEAVAARAKLIRDAAKAPQPAPPVPVPPVPVPPPTAPAGLPPISAQDAGMDAAILDNIGAMVDLLVRQRDAIDHKITTLKTAAAEFGNPAAANALPPPLQTSETVAGATAIEGTNAMFGPNWQTSFSGLGAILGAAAGIAHSISVGQMPDATQMGVIFAAISAGVGLIQAKDKNVTGGTVPATNEAKRRVGS